MKSHSESYKKAGVDITAGYRAVELIKKHIARTHIKGVASDIGGFCGLFELDLSGYENPILVSVTDGVGTKLKLAFTLDKHDTIGIDCVAMCVNDIVCSGARPLFFLDYLAVGKNYPEKIERIVAGVAEGCVQAGCALIGGETAEMPGFYRDGEYDLAGFAVGIDDKKKMLDSSKVKVGDVIIGLPSSGIHSNGFSLVRKIIGDAGLDLTSYSQYTDSILGDARLAPTKIYVKPVLSLIEKVNVKSVAHITGGGFYENIPRALPDGIMAKIEKSVIKVPPIFKLLQVEGAVPVRDMFNIFNMGIGMCVIVAKKDADKALEILKEAGEDAYIIGETVKGSGVDLC